MVERPERIRFRREVIGMSRFETENADDDLRGTDDLRATEVPEADRAEQLTPAADDPAEDRDEPEATPLEVDPADAAEQRRSVPVDEDYPHG